MPSIITKLQIIIVTFKEDEKTGQEQLQVMCSPATNYIIDNTPSILILKRNISKPGYGSTKLHELYELLSYNFRSNSKKSDIVYFTFKLDQEQDIVIDNNISLGKRIYDIFNTAFMECRKYPESDQGLFSINCSCTP